MFAQIGAVQAVARESYFMAIEGNQTLLLLVNMIFSYLALVLSFFFLEFLLRCVALTGCRRGRIGVRRHRLEETLVPGTQW